MELKYSHFLTTKSRTQKTLNLTKVWKIYMSHFAATRLLLTKFDNVAFLLSLSILSCKFHINMTLPFFFQNSVKHLRRRFFQKKLKAFRIFFSKRTFSWIEEKLKFDSQDTYVLVFSVNPQASKFTFLVEK